MNNYKLEWKTIYYHDELETNGSLLYTEYTQEADYIGGKLVKHTHEEWNELGETTIRNESMCFVPNEKVSRETYNESPLKNYIKTLEKSLDLDKKVGNLQGLKEILI